MEMPRPKLNDALVYTHNSLPTLSRKGVQTGSYDHGKNWGLESTGIEVDVEEWWEMVDTRSPVPVDEHTRLLDRRDERRQCPGKVDIERNVVNTPGTEMASKRMTDGQDGKCMEDSDIHRI